MVSGTMFVVVVSIGISLGITVLFFATAVKAIRTQFAIIKKQHTHATRLIDELSGQLDGAGRMGCQIGSSLANTRTVLVGEEPHQLELRPGCSIHIEEAFDTVVALAPKPCQCRTCRSLLRILNDNTSVFTARFGELTDMATWTGSFDLGGGMTAEIEVAEDDNDIESDDEEVTE